MPRAFVSQVAVAAAASALRVEAWVRWPGRRQRRQLRSVWV